MAHSFIFYDFWKKNSNQLTPNSIRLKYKKFVTTHVKHVTVFKLDPNGPYLA